MYLPKSLKIYLYFYSVCMYHRANLNLGYTISNNGPVYFIMHKLPNAKSYPRRKGSNKTKLY